MIHHSREDLLIAPESICNTRGAKQILADYVRFKGGLFTEASVRVIAKANCITLSVANITDKGMMKLKPKAQSSISQKDKPTS